MANSMTSLQQAASPSLSACRRPVFSLSPALGTVALLALALLIGCNARPPMTPVRGKVLYNGKPLQFGVVMLHPPQGQIAQAQIQPDGTFELATFDANDGVIPGVYQVSVLCFEGHDPAVASPAEDENAGFLLGKPLIPLKYTRARTSGLTANVALDSDQEIVLELTGPK